jgi:hypothetical protein
LIDGVPVLSEQFAPVALNRKYGYGITRVNDYLLTVNSIGKPDRALLDP